MISSALCLSPESYEVYPRQVFWLILFWLPSHSTLSVTVAGYARTIVGFTAAGTAPGFNGIPSSHGSESIRSENLKSRYKNKNIFST